VGFLARAVGWLSRVQAPWPPANFIVGGHTIAINVLVMNLEKLLELLFVVFRVLLPWIKGQLDAWRVARMSPSTPAVVAVA
jgi:hypothetical protein